MYFGSVKFFKHLIVSILILLITVPTILAVVFIVKYQALKAQPPVTVKPNSSAHLTPSELMSQLLHSVDFSKEDVLTLFEEHNMDFQDYVYKHYYSDDNDELSYQKKYPDLNVDPPKAFKTKENVVYLTFDDGPSSNTRDVLAILDKYNIKATFFVVGNEDPAAKIYLKEIVARGHSIGVHTYTHDYTNIYSSVDAYLDDFYKAYNYIYTATGVKPNIFRFAGGSINIFNGHLYKQIIAEMTRRGFVYYDWNVSAEDAMTNATWTSIYNNVLNSLKGKSRAVVLMHDGPGRHVTVTALEDLIKVLLADGYTFDKLTHNDKPITFGYIDK